MNIVFTMAGKYSRFKLFGAQVPKYLLPLGQGTILSKIISEIQQVSNGNRLYFIANRDDQLFYPILKSILKQYNIDEGQLIYIDDTSSQLETALQARELVRKQTMADPICFANIDTVVMNRVSFFESLSVAPAESALLDTFQGRSNKYSYARVDENASVLEVVDSNIVSEFACSGLYGFGSFSKMLCMTEELLQRETKANFTRLYNMYIEKNQSVTHIPATLPNDTVVLGTPEEYVINIHRFSQ